MPIIPRRVTWSPFIHLGYLCSASSSPLLLRGVPDYSTDTVSEFHAETLQAIENEGLAKGIRVVWYQLFICAHCHNTTVRFSMDYMQWRSQSLEAWGKVREVQL